MAAAIKMSEERNVSADDFCAAVGETPERLPAKVRELLQALNGRYRSATPTEQDAAVLAVLKRLHTERLARTAAENREVFERGWAENLELCRREGVSTSTLRPKYVRPWPTIRYQGHYIIPDNPYLTDDLWTIIMTWVFLKYFDSIARIYEFGTGTGRYLHLVAQLFPGRTLVGLDWSGASMAILGLIAKATGENISGRQFDMLEPRSDTPLEPGSGVFTVGSMEQLGDRFQPFLDFLLDGAPRLVAHFEPIVEFYRDDTLFDYLAILSHRHRNYLSGYYPALRSLAAEGRIEVLEARRLYYGDLYNEGSSLIVWRSRQ